MLILAFQKKMDKVKRTGEDFRNQAEELKLISWPQRGCSFCGAMIGYRFVDGKAFYDSNCNCVNYTTPLQPRSWDDIADFYNMQNNPVTIEEMDNFWEFGMFDKNNKTT